MFPSTLRRRRPVPYEALRSHDPYVAYVVPAKAMAMTAIDLLANGAAEGQRIRTYKPPHQRDLPQMWEKL